MNEAPHFVIRVPSERVGCDESKIPPHNRKCGNELSPIEAMIRREEIYELIDALKENNWFGVCFINYTYEIIPEDREDIRLEFGNKAAIIGINTTCLVSSS